MFTDEPDEYLLQLKDFLLAQEAKNQDPAAAAVIAQIYRELLRRVSLQTQDNVRLFVH